MEEKILSDWFEAGNQRDYDRLEKLYSEDALVHAKDGDLRGGSAVVGIFKRWEEAFPDLNITPLHITHEGDVIVVHWKSEGTFINPIREYKPTGKKVVIHGLTCFRCKDNKVIEHWASVDYRPLQKV